MADADGSSRWRVFVATSCGVAAASLNASMLAVALPALVADLNASATASTWVLLAYMVVTTVLILSFGRLSDLLGRRRVYLVGTAVFVAFSLACGLAPDVGWLIAARVGQGVGAAAVITNSTALLVDVFPRRSLSLALGYNLAVASAANALGPVLGGVLVDTLGWRAVFLVLVPAGLAGLAIGMAVLPTRGRAGHPASLNLGSTALLFAALTLGLYALSDPFARWAVPVGITGLVMIGGFVLIQHVVSDPLLDLRLLRHRARAMAYAANFVMSTGRMVVVVLASLYIQTARGGSALEAGSALFPYAAGIMAGSVAGGWLARASSARTVSTWGALVSAIGLVALVAESGGGGRPPIQIGLALVGLGNGAFMTPNTTDIMSTVAAEQRGIANGLRSMLQNTGQAISTATGLAVLTAGLTGSARHAVYAGALAALAPDEVDTFVEGYRAALLMLVGLALVGGLLSLSRGRAPGDGERVGTGAR